MSNPLQDDPMSNYDWLNNQTENETFNLGEMYEDFPSESLGFALIAPLMIGALFCGALTKLIVMKCSNWQERFSRQRHRAHWEGTRERGDTGETEGSAEDRSGSDHDTDEDTENATISGGDTTHASSCLICNQHFQLDDLIYESNNPKCKHLHHKACMDKWLQYKYLSSVQRSVSPSVGIHSTATKCISGTY